MGGWYELQRISASEGRFLAPMPGLRPKSGAPQAPKHRARISRYHALASLTCAPVAEVLVSGPLPASICSMRSPETRKRPCMASALAGLSRLYQTLSSSAAGARRSSSNAQIAAAHCSAWLRAADAYAAALSVRVKHTSCPLEGQRTNVRGDSLRPLGSVFNFSQRPRASTLGSHAPNHAIRCFVPAPPGSIRDDRQNEVRWVLG